ncbi:bifunctional lysylphosphatidylglycerol synthetase/lysine--tRNA ligase LysX [Allokutzneria sp. NRRL B-24872]|uniref:bifunctional lysylphosphatidylglycerol synthetase/lysine--tRNA ligase LysX n=1 Tax=Allokutzneria sp. NRRL B-24872 TaxID=1137961 RepID=UPI000A37E6F4|nr:bifunctional lysylphosphatidylglycerol synthetase/lysine--tRNA ligase LysX [Allokutzneria sp. NRRL B-24872]
MGSDSADNSAATGKQTATTTADKPRRTSRPPRHEVPAWKHTAAAVIATVVELGALCSLVLLLLGDDYTDAGDAIRSVFDYTGLPVDANIFIVLVLVVLGAALRRRKRAALWVLVLFQVLYVVVYNAIVALIWLYLLAIGDATVSEDDLQDLAVSDTLWDLVMANLVGIGLIVVLLVLRPAFPARLNEGAGWRALGSLAIGMVLVTLIGWGLAPFASATPSGTLEQLLWSFSQVTGNWIPIDQIGIDQASSSWLTFLLDLSGTLVGAYALARFFRSARSKRLLSQEEELALRELLAEHGDGDSLGYFATRRDKSVVFAPSGRAAVTYRVIGGTCLASGDPIGDEDAWPAAINAWLAEAYSYGWVPGVLGTSEEGAHAYTEAGLKALEIGDEAILDVRDFTLTGRERRGVRQAVSRVERAGYTARVRRHGEIPDEEMDQLIAAAQMWRGEATERGFSMALGRLGDPSDARCVMVEAYDADGALRGLLSFVPWGRTGLSMDLMRRDRAAENGLNEFMICELVEAGGRLGVQHISLNFAMFRAVFEEGARIGAGPVLRLWRWALSFASRFFQLESLYRSNAKYGPKWDPRFLCYRSARQLARVSLIAGVAEGFVPSRRALLRPSVARRELHTPEVAEAFVQQVHAIEERVREPKSARRLPEQVRVRRDKLDRLREEGVDAYPVGFTRGCSLGEARERAGELAPDTRTGTRVSVAGRVVAKREVGRLCFAVLRDFTGELQLMLSEDQLGAERLAAWKTAIDLGDQVGVEGEVITSKRGELSVSVTEWMITAKCLHPLPDRRKGLADAEARVRRRYLDLVVNDEARTMLRARSTVVRTLRESLHTRGFLEVETPMLQAVHGGATARPFVTHINAYDMRMYLRIAPELYLKRLCVAGVDRVFELNRNFRNEGADATHNPEFTMLEAYQSYADYNTMLHTVRELIQEAAVAAHGAQVARHTNPDGTVTEHDISGEWPVIGVHEALAQRLDEEITPDTPFDELRKHFDAAGVPFQDGWSRGKYVVEAFEHLVEGQTVRPTFYRDYPTDVSPLTRQHREDPRLAERWDLIAFGAEIATAYSELTDPVEQRERLQSQSMKAASGDVEAMELDEDFLRALEYGMPPTGGLGLGVDRLLMMLCGGTIRQTVLFPFVRPEGSSV